MQKALSLGTFLFACVISAVAVRGYAAGIDPQFAAGNTLLDSIPPVPEGKTEKSYFEVQLNRRAVGIGEVTLGCRRADNGQVYDYRHHLAVKLPTNVLMTVDIQAVLTPRFQPLAIDVQRSMTLPDGQAFTGTQSMTIEGNKIVLQSNEGDVKSTREFAAPNVNFVYAMDAFIPRMEKKQKKPFALYNFDMESGGLAEIHCQWIVNEQRKEQLSVSKDRGKTVDEYYLFEFSGNYLGYGKMDPPFLEIKTTETQQAEVKKLLGLE